VVGDTSGVVVEGARLFHEKGCEFCHAIDGFGGKRGPELTEVGGRMAADAIATRITNGGPNMPAYARTLTPQQVDALVAFLGTRKP
jgi:ubiquinol-cytochrome c reductase cytochrome b subunit